MNARKYDVERAILEELRTRLTGSYARRGCVPIHVIRAAVRERLGDEAASHYMFDQAIRTLDRRGLVLPLPL